MIAYYAEAPNNRDILPPAELLAKHEVLRASLTSSEINCQALCNALQNDGFYGLNSIYRPRKIELWRT